MNSGKCHLILVLMMKVRKYKIMGEVINKSQIQKLLAVHIDYELKFDTYIETLCEKVGKNIFALSRVIKFMFKNEAQLLMRSFMMSQFSYCETHLDVS